MVIVTKKDVQRALKDSFSQAELKKMKLAAYEEAIGSDEAADILHSQLYRPIIKQLAKKLGVSMSSMSYDTIEDVVMDELPKVKAEIKV